LNPYDLDGLQVVLIGAGLFVIGWIVLAIWSFLTGLRRK
jgi:hypothetical protein